MPIEPIRISAATYAPPSSHRRGRVWGDVSTIWILCFVALGFLACLGVSELMRRYDEIGAWGALAVVILGPVALFAGAAALPEAYRKLATLRRELRWWHWLLLLLYISTLVFRKRDQDASQSDPLDAWAMLRIVPEMIVGGVLIARLLRRQTTWIASLFKGLPGALAIYALLCALSTVWSVYPLWTLYKSLELLLDVAVLAAALASIHDLKEYKSLLSWIWTIYAIELAWVWMQLPLWPSDAFEDGRLKGVYPATAWNAVGQSGAVLAIIALCRLLPLGGRKTDRAFSGVLFVFGMASLLMSQTRNALGGFIAAAALVLILTRRTWLAVVGAGMGAVVWGFSRFGGTVVTFLERDQSTESMQNLTGRAEFWSYAWQQFLAHPLTGLGAYAAGRFAVMTKLHIDTGTLHSDWIEMLVGIGIMGLIPFAYALFQTWWYLLRSIHDASLDLEERQIALQAVGVLAVIFVHSFFNDELTWHAPLLFLSILGYAELLRRRAKRKEKRIMDSRPLPIHLARPVSPSTT